VKYELGFYIPEDDILHSDRRESPKSYKKPGCFEVMLCRLTYPIKRKVLVIRAAVCVQRCGLWLVQRSVMRV
jgi:hypothetical protein